jgi:hypothetical protein
MASDEQKPADVPTEDGRLEDEEIGEVTGGFQQPYLFDV